MSKLATSVVNLSLDDGYNTVEWHELYEAPWPAIVAMVNEHNKKFVQGDEPFVMRVWCPWEGFELHIPQTCNEE